MEVQNKRGLDEVKQTAERRLIVDLWQQLGKPAVDARLLATIQSRLNAAPDSRELHGPAAIARLLADEGAELKHPEIIETDAAWRQARIETRTSESRLEFDSGQVMTLISAEAFILKLE